MSAKDTFSFFTARFVTFAIYQLKRLGYGYITKGLISKSN
jgi:hypothetical protein